MGLYAVFDVSSGAGVVGAVGAFKYVEMVWHLRMMLELGADVEMRPALRGPSTGLRTSGAQDDGSGV